MHVIRLKYYARKVGHQVYIYLKMSASAADLLL